MRYQTQAYIINLVERVDKRKDIEQQFANINSIKPKIIPAIKHDIGKIGCLLSHQAIVAMAKQLKYDMVIAIEDDCCLSSDFDDKWPAIEKWLVNNKNKWDVYNGGLTCVKSHKVKLLNGKLNIARANGLRTQFIVYNSSIYDKVLNIPVGTAIDQFTKHRTRMVTSVPFLTTQCPAVSDIKGYYRDDTYKFINTEKVIIRKINKDKKV
jgi:GR25 family glycosyltransferase involved in LPS biosynthesis